jgi:hypothetical protein
MIETKIQRTVKVLPDCSMAVQATTLFIKDGSVVGHEGSDSYTLAPGDSLKGKPAEVVSIAETLWTPEVIEAYAAAHPIPEPEVIVVEKTVVDASVSTESTSEVEIVTETSSEN